jgi:hypothetical protein
LRFGIIADVLIEAAWNFTEGSRQSLTNFAETCQLVLPCGTRRTPVSSELGPMMYIERNVLRRQWDIPWKVRRYGDSHRVQFPLSGLHGPQGGKAHKEKQALHNLRSMRDSTLRSRTCGNRGIQPPYRTRRARRIANETQGDGASLPADLSRVREQILGGTKAHQDKRFRRELQRFPLSAE